MKLVHWPLMGGLLHLVQGRGDWTGLQPSVAPLPCTKCNSPPINSQCTNHRNAGALLCGFNVPIKGLNAAQQHVHRTEAHRTNDALRAPAVH